MEMTKFLLISIFFSYKTLLSVGKTHPNTLKKVNSKTPLSLQNAQIVYFSKLTISNL